MNKTERIIVRFDKQERRALAALGGRRGMSAVLRKLVRTEAKRRGLWPARSADRKAA